MTNNQTLPIEVHEHFRKANVLHTYVQKDLGEASKHALETGQELLAAKATVPHGRWENECERLFDGSLRTAQFYMQFTRDFGKLKSAQKSALLMLEGTLDGAAKAAKKAANPKPTVAQVQDAVDEPQQGPPWADAVEKADGGQPTAAQVQEAVFDAHMREEDAPPLADKPSKPPRKKPPKVLDKKAYYKQWDHAIGPLMRVLDKIANGVGEKHGPSHKAILGHLDICTEEMQEWMGVE